MSKKFEYIIVIFLTGLLVILFRWSENGRYEVHTAYSSMIMVDTRSGDIWTMGKGEEKWYILPSIHK